MTAVAVPVVAAGAIGILGTQAMTGTTGSAEALHANVSRGTRPAGDVHGTIGDTRVVARDPAPPTSAEEARAERPSATVRASGHRGSAGAERRTGDSGAASAAGTAGSITVMLLGLLVAVGVGMAVATGTPRGGMRRVPAVADGLAAGDLTRPGQPAPTDEPGPAGTPRQTARAGRADASSGPVHDPGAGPDDLVDVLLVECHEHLDQLESDLVAPGANSRERLSSSHGAIQAIEGLSGFLVFDRLEEVAHAGGTMLSLLRDAALAPTPARTGVLLRMVATVRSLLASIEATGGEGAVDVRAVVAAIGAAMDDGVAEPAAEFPAATGEVTSACRRAATGGGNGDGGHGRSHPRKRVVPHSPAGAATLGSDLVRLPTGRSVAEVLVRRSADPPDHGTRLQRGWTLDRCPRPPTCSRPRRAAPGPPPSRPSRPGGS